MKTHKCNHYTKPRHPLLIITECNQYLINQHEGRASLSVSHSSYTGSGAEEAIIYKEYDGSLRRGCWLSYSNYQWIQMRNTPNLYQSNAAIKRNGQIHISINNVLFFFTIAHKRKNCYVIVFNTASVK